MSSGNKEERRTLFFWCFFAITVIMFIITQYLLKNTEINFFALSSISFFAGAIFLVDAKYALFPPKYGMNPSKSFFFYIGKLHIYQKIVYIRLALSYTIAVLSGSWGVANMLFEVAK